MESQNPKFSASNFGEIFIRVYIISNQNQNLGKFWSALQ
jgi:hypothetical protein